MRLQPYVRLYRLIRSLRETSPSVYQFLTAREVKTALETAQIVDTAMVSYILTPITVAKLLVSTELQVSNHLRALDFIT